MENSPELNHLWLSDGRNFFSLTRAQKTAILCANRAVGFLTTLPFKIRIGMDRDEPGWIGYLWEFCSVFSAEAEGVCQDPFISSIRSHQTSCKLLGREKAPVSCQKFSGQNLLWGIPMNLKSQSLLHLYTMFQQQRTPLAFPWNWFRGKSTGTMQILHVWSVATSRNSRFLWIFTGKASEYPSLSCHSPEGSRRQRVAVHSHPPPAQPIYDGKQRRLDSSVIIVIEHDRVLIERYIMIHSLDMSWNCVLPWNKQLISTNKISQNHPVL